jgi:myo-inositol catabolism protein IolS
MAQLGFGAWQIGGPHQIHGRENGWGPVSRGDALGLVARARTLGVSFFDTAQGYGDSELVLGEARATLAIGPEMTVCTKIGWDGLAAGSGLQAMLRAKIDRSRARLQQDRLDVVLLHNPPSDAITEATLDALDALRSVGLVGAFGLSARTLADLRTATHIGFGQWLEWNCSPLERRVEGETLTAIHAAGIRFIGRSPLFRGLITDAFLARGPEAPFEQDVRVNLDVHVRRWAHAQLRELAVAARDFGLTTSGFALARLRASDAVDVVIPGIRTQAHLDDLEAVLALDDNTLRRVAAVPATWEATYPGFA